MCSYIKHTGICVFVLFMKRKTNQKYVDKTRDAFVCWWCILEIKTLLSRFFSICIFWTYMEFYHGYAKIKGMPRLLFYDIPCYVTMDYEKWYTSLLLTQCEETSFNTMWRNLCTMSITCRFHVSDVVLTLYVLLLKWSVAVPISLPLLKHIVDKNW